ncbi:MAG TPA: endonuclease III [Beijerinckiaceae bacterium]|nr:endonuclease III [Beijerinckiaceae bacterium]
MFIRKPLTTRKIAAPKAGRPEAVAARPARRPRPPKPVDQATLVEIFRRFRETNPEPKGELEHVDAYTLTVAVVLSAQATDAGVNKATRELFKVADTPQKMVALGEERLRGYIKTVNFNPTKARNIIALSRKLVDEHGGVVPPARAVLESLPGVGRKSASVVLNMAFGEPTIAVDTHIYRVSNRIPLVVTKTPDETQVALETIVPDEFRLHCHHWLILHGRYVCKARKPECYRCLIRDLCRFEPKTPAPDPVSLAGKGRGRGRDATEPPLSD